MSNIDFVMKVATIRTVYTAKGLSWSGTPWAHRMTGSDEQRIAVTMIAGEVTEIEVIARDTVANKTINQVSINPAYVVDTPDWFQRLVQNVKDLAA